MAKDSHIRSENGSGNGLLNDGSFGILDDILAMAGSVINNRKHNAAAKLGEFAGSVRDFADSVPDIAMLKDYAGAVAHSVEGIADYVTDTEFEVLVSDLGDFMRNHPMVAVAGSVAGGLVLAHIVKGSMSPDDDDATLSRSRRRNRSSARKMSDA